MVFQRPRGGNLPLLKLPWGSSGWILGKAYFSKRVVRQWHRLPREVAVTVPGGVQEQCGDVALRDMVSGHGLGSDLVILEVFSNLNHFVIFKSLFCNLNNLFNVILCICKYI